MPRTKRLICRFVEVAESSMAETPQEKLCRCDGVNGGRGWKIRKTLAENQGRLASFIHQPQDLHTINLLAITRSCC
jgi:hypothetical protein